ncbi:hypothetical protein C2845_PM11G19640 [Panicum miliaceum]|uniref:Protein kinase domain-containing protein n=1 Tax=Panicum miliaceum TaxID=4540 RepID=A0A3L6RQF9_PANMI|nr:hypothetical protein C2845_PM11G19640 [Panicum miliaceum]
MRENDLDWNGRMAEEPDTQGVAACGDQSARWAYGVRVSSSAVMGQRVDMNALGQLANSLRVEVVADFGLARLYNHDANPHTTHVVGTMGYLAPKPVRTGRATTLSDVFAFDVFVLEVACDQRPIEEEDDATVGG